MWDQCDSKSIYSRFSFWTNVRTIVGRQNPARAQISDAESVLECVRLLLTVLLASVCPRHDLVVENLLLRHQLAVLTRPTRTRRRARLLPWDKLLWVLARRFCAGWREHLTFVTPETVVRWHRQGWRLLSRCRRTAGRSTSARARARRAPHHRRAPHRTSRRGTGAGHPDAPRGASDTGQPAHRTAVQPCARVSILSLRPQQRHEPGGSRLVTRFGDRPAMAASTPINTAARRARVRAVYSRLRVSIGPWLDATRTMTPGHSLPC